MLTLSNRRGMGSPAMVASRVPLRMVMAPRPASGSWMREASVESCPLSHLLTVPDHQRGYKQGHNAA